MNPPLDTNSNRFNKNGHSGLGLCRVSMNTSYLNQNRRSPEHVKKLKNDPKPPCVLNQQEFETQPPTKSPQQLSQLFSLSKESFYKKPTHNSPNQSGRVSKNSLLGVSNLKKKQREISRKFGISHPKNSRTRHIDPLTESYSDTAFEQQSNRYNESSQEGWEFANDEYQDINSGELIHQNNPPVLGLKNFRNMQDDHSMTVQHKSGPKSKQQMEFNVYSLGEREIPLNFPN